MIYDMGTHIYVTCVYLSFCVSNKKKMKTKTAQKRQIVVLLYNKRQMPYTVKVISDLPKIQGSRWIHSSIHVQILVKI